MKQLLFYSFPLKCMRNNNVCTANCQQQRQKNLT